MKKYIIAIIAVLFSFLSANMLFAAPDTWTQKADFGGTAREFAAGFSIGNKGYIGTGTDFYDISTGLIPRKDFWEYDPVANTWTQKADFGGTARLGAVGFSIGSKGYIGTGRDVSRKKDFWEYDPVANTWTQKADFGGAERQGAVGFSIGSKGYIGTGWYGYEAKDFWEYDSVANTWTRKADFGGTARHDAVGFSIGSKGYIGTGWDYDSNDRKDFWEYDPVANTWTQKADFGGTARYIAVGFSIESKGYIGTGSAEGYEEKDFWEYDPVANTWTQKADFGGTARYGAKGFSIGSKGYIGTGGQDDSYIKDFWEFEPTDTTPQQFTFTDYTGVPLNTLFWSNTITVSGINTPAPISITGGQYAIYDWWYGWSFTNADGWVINGDFVLVRQLSSGNYSTTTNATLTIGGVSDTFSLTTLDDTTPNKFFFNDRTGVPLNTWFSSNTITVSGISAAAPISITGGLYSINYMPYTSASGTVNNGSMVTVRQVSSGSYSTTTNATLTIGGVSDTFSLTTQPAPPDTTPDQFIFTDQTNVALNTVITSNTITISGIVTAAPISITGGTYSINGGPYTSTDSTVNNGDTVRVQQTSSGNYSTTTNAMLTIGGVSDTFGVTTQAAPPDTTPNQFTFTDQTGVALSTAITSNTIMVAGINTAAPISIVGGTYSFNSGSSTSADGTVSNGDTVTVRQTSSGSYSTTTNAMLTIGGVSDTFSVTTQAVPVANTWTQKADFGGTARRSAVGFSIGSKGYVGTGGKGDGSTFYKDFWEYDPAANAWTQKADFGGTARQWAVGFSIGSKGYIGTGYDGSFKKDFWEYDSVANSWTQKADFGGTARGNAVGFSIGSKGYIGTGYDNSNKKDFWEYDSVANSWTQKTDFGGTVRQGAVGFSIGSKGYIGTGLDGSYTKDFWEYDPTANSWTQKADFGGTGRIYAVGLSIGSKGYIGTGQADSIYYKDLWEYDPVANIWTQKADFGGTARSLTAGFSIGSKGYVGMGYSSGSNYKNIWEYETADTAPDQFTFTDQTGVALSAVMTSNTITVSGINTTATISIAGGQYAINGGSYTSAGGTVNNGDTITVQQTSSGNYSTTTNATLTIGGVSDTFSVTTLAAPSDTTPDQFTFTDQTGLALSTVITSNAITVSGINAAAAISITGGQYAINGGSYTSTTGTVNNSNTVTVQQTSSGSYSTATDATLTIGGVSDTFSVTTQAAPPDTTPDQFTFTDQTGMALSTVTTSNTITVAGIVTAASISITGGTYSINGGSYTSANGTVNNGNTITVQQISSGNYSTTTDATLTIGGVSDTFSVTTQAAPPDTTPDQFTFTDRTGVAPSTAITSNTITVAGINTAAPISIVGGTYSINSGSSTSADGTVNDGDTVTVRQTSSGNYSTMTNATLTIGGVSDTFSVTTQDEPVGDTWTQKADFGGTERFGGVGFSIGNKGYIGTGLNNSYSYTRDFWEYDPAANTWTQKADFGGTERYGAVGFSIGSKGYIGTGFEVSYSRTKDFWEYDPAANTWTQKADFGGTERYGAVGFSIGSKGYIGTGSIEWFGGASLVEDFWEYDQAANTWTQKADFGGRHRDGAVGFSIGSKGYIGTGYNGSYTYDFWEYDPSTNAWTQKADFGPIVPQVQCNAVGFSIGSKGYIGTGFIGSYTKDFWEYDPALNTWTQRADFGGIGRYMAVGFSIGSKGYIGTGDGEGVKTKDFWEYEPADTTPDQFTFTDQTGVALSTVMTSNTITVAGINAAAAISITGGQYAINSGSYTSADGTVNNGDTVTVQQTSSASYSTTTDATLTIGGVSDTFSVTTLDDTTPDQFTFIDQTGVVLSTVITSNTITVSGINAAAPIFIVGGTYAINGGSYTSVAGTVSNGNTVTVQQTSSGNYSTMTNATLTIGGVSDTFSVTTQDDTTPDQFTLIDQTDVALSTVITSNAITVSGINAATPISIVGGTYAINGGSYTSAAGTVNNANTVTVQQTSSESYSTTTNATLTIGGVSDTFSVTTQDDTTGPSLSITSHSDGQLVNATSMTLSGTASDSGKGGNGIQQVTVNGSPANNGTVAGNGTANWSKMVTLSGGANAITVIAYDDSLSHNQATQSITIYYDVTDTTGPSLMVTSHSNGQHVSTPSITLNGTASDSGNGDNGIQQVTVNGSPANNGTASGNGTANWSKGVFLNAGANTITVIAYDDSPNHNTTTQSITIYFDSVASGISYKIDSGAPYTYIQGVSKVTLWQGDLNDGYFDLSLGDFDFQFYGTPVTNIRVSTNGYLTFGTDGENWDNVLIPNANLPNALIALFWDDLDLTGLSGDRGVWWGLFGTAPDRYLVIEWRQVPSYEFEAEAYSFEVILYETTDKIKFQYEDVDSGTTHDFGASATVGIENFDGRKGVQYSFNGSKPLSNGLAIEFTPQKRPEKADFDGDGKTDVAVYNKSSGWWFIMPSGGSPYGVGWGGDASDIPVPGDYDGDGSTDVAIYRGNTGVWWITPSSGAPAYPVGWGGPGYKPVPGDYDGDGKADIAIYESGTGVWWIIPSSGAPAYGVGWGGAGFTPVPADYDGDGKADIAIYGLNTGVWWIIPSSGAPAYGVGWGGAGYTPLPADYDGDGKADIAIYEAGTGVWWMIPSSGAPAYGVGWGGPVFTPVPGDYDGDGKTDIAIYEASTGAWWMVPSSGAPAYGVGWGGAPGDVPITANVP